MIARLGAAAPRSAGACSASSRPAARPLTMTELADVAAAYERTADHRPPPRSSSAPRRGEGPIDADLAAGLAEGVEHGVLPSPTTRSTSGTSSSGARSSPISCRASGTATTSRSRPALVGHPAAAAYHWNEAHATTQARDAAIAAAGRAEAVYSPQDALENLELALSSVAPAAANGETDAGIADDHGSELRRRPAQRLAAPAARRGGGVRGRSLGARRGLRRDRDQLARRAPRPRRARAAARAAGPLPARGRRLERRAGRAASGRCRSCRRRRSVERATVLAALAQVRMLEGTFSEAESLAREAIAVATACEPEAQPQMVHATTTLGVSLGWGEDPEAGVALLREALGLAAEMGDHDETVPGLRQPHHGARPRRPARGGGRRSRTRASRRRRQAGLEAVYGNFLRGNAADSLFLLGRWPESQRDQHDRPRMEPRRGRVRRTRSTAWRSSRSRPTPARPPAGCSASCCSSSRRSATPSTPCRSTARRPRSRCGGATTPTPGGRPSAAGSSSSDTGDWSLIAKMAATVAEVDSMAARRGPDRPRPRGPGRRSGAGSRDGPRRRRGGRPAIRRRARRSARAARPTPSSHGGRPPRSARGSRRSRGLGGARRALVGARATRTRWPRPAGARPRRSSAAARVARRGRGRGRRSRRPPRSGSASRPGRCSASCASWPAGR